MLWDACVKYYWQFQNYEDITWCRDFIITFENAEPIYAALPMNQGNIEYDRNGSILNPSLRIVKVNSIPDPFLEKNKWNSIENEGSSNKEIYITSENMPIKIQYVDKISGKQTNIYWEKY